MKRLPLISSVVLFVLLCVSATYWTTYFFKPASRKVAAPVTLLPQAQTVTVASVFGGGALAVISNYQLKGVVLANPSQQSVAIIAANGKPAQAYPINTEVGPGVVLSEVYATHVVLQDNGISKRVDLPQDPVSSIQRSAAVMSRYPEKSLLSRTPSSVTVSPGRASHRDEQPMPATMPGFGVADNDALHKAVE